MNEKLEIKKLQIDVQLAAFSIQTLKDNLAQTHIELEESRAALAEVNAKLAKLSDDVHDKEPGE